MAPPTLPEPGAAPGRPSPRPVRVVHVVGGTRTGATHMVLGLCRRHDRTRIDPALCFHAIVAPDAEVIETVGRLGIPYRSVVKARRYDAVTVVHLALALRSLGAEVAVLHGFGGYTFGAFAARLARVRASVRVEHSPELHSRAHRLATRVATPLVDSTILVSRFLLAYLDGLGLHPPRPEVIENGIELAPFTAVARPVLSGDLPAVVLMAARLDRPKDHATLLDAMALLGSPARRGRPLRLRLAGEGPLEGALRAQAARLGIVDRVEFLGQRADMARLLEEADVAVLSTDYEGFGLVVAEAMAAARPVVATRVSSLPELVDDGKTGWLVPGHDAHAMAGAIARLVDDPDGARAMGLAGRRTAVARFDAEVAARAFERHLLDCAARRGVPVNAPAPVGPAPSDAA